MAVASDEPVPGLDRTFLALDDIASIANFILVSVGLDDPTATGRVEWRS